MSAAPSPVGTDRTTGFGILALGATLLLAAGAFDAEPLYVPGVALVLGALGAMAWVALAARGIGVERALAASSVVEGQPVGVAITVRAGGVALPPGAVHDSLVDRRFALRAGRRAQTVRFEVTFARRGRRAIPGPRVVVGDPFGMAVTTVAPDVDHGVLVLPRTEAIRLASAGAGADTLGLQHGRPRPATEIDFDGVRPHRPGSPASRIVWAAYARSGELLERRMVADADALPLVALDARTEDRAASDRAVRAAASLALHLARAGGCALLVPGERRARTIDETLTGWPRAHVALALVAGDEAPALAALATRSGPIVFVSARGVAGLPTALADGAGGGRVLVVPDPLGGRRAAFSVAGCHGYEVGAPTRDARRVVA